MRYAKALIEDIEYDETLTWENLCDRYSKTKEQLYATLQYHEYHDLIERVNEASGVVAREPYLKRMVRVIRSDKTVTWGMLSVLFKNREKETMASALYKAGYRDLVQQVNKASRKALL